MRFKCMTGLVYVNSPASSDPVLLTRQCKSVFYIVGSTLHLTLKLENSEKHILLAICNMPEFKQLLESAMCVQGINELKQCTWFSEDSSVTVSAAYGCGTDREPTYQISIVQPQWRESPEDEEVSDIYTVLFPQSIVKALVALL